MTIQEIDVRITKKHEKQRNRLENNEIHENLINSSENHENY